MNNNEKNQTCCFIGHRKISITDRLKNDLFDIIKALIVNNVINHFLFGSKSEFNDLCLKVVSELKELYPSINRIYVRAEYPYINDDYEKYLLENYEKTYYPEHIKGAGRAVYVERNFEMIKQSDYCIFYYDKNYCPPKRKTSVFLIGDYQPKSGTEMAYKYALKNCKHVINVFK